MLFADATNPENERATSSRMPQSWERRIGWAVFFFVAVDCLWTFSLPFRLHDALMGFAEDDFYYYLKTAQNFAAGRGSTFDGITHTNGFHPLYFLLLAGVAHFLHTLRQFFAFLWLLDSTSALVIFWTARRIFARATASPVLAQAYAVIALMPCIATISLQMETTLALPLGFALLDIAFVSAAQYTARRCAGLGLLSALLMLARLDAGLLVFTLLVSFGLIPAMRTVFRPAATAWFAGTALPPLCVYAALNRHYFKIWLPISGMAKELRYGWMPDPAMLRPSFSGFTLLILLFVLMCGVAAAVLRRSMQPEEHLLCLAATLMPVVFYALELVISDWKLWPWYMYATRFAFLAGLVVVAAHVARRGWANTPWFAPTALVLVLFALVRTHYKVDPAMIQIEHESKQLSEFAAVHPGRYAMGDRAGMFGYRSGRPLLQAEGLMMNSTYLQHLRREDDLRSTLVSYGVDYYVAFVFASDTQHRFNDDCFLAEEPSIAGHYAMRMRSTFCSEPAFTYETADGKYLIYALSPHP